MRSLERNKVIVTTGIALCVGVILGFTDPVLGFVLVTACALAAALFVVLRKRRPIDVFEPTVVIFVVYVLTYFTSALEPLFGGVDSRHQPYYMLTVLYAYLSLVVFLFCYSNHLGLRLAKSLPRVSGRWSFRRVRLVVIVFSIIGFCGYYIGMQMVGGVGFYLENLGSRIALAEGVGYIFQIRNFAVTANVLWFASILVRYRVGLTMSRLEWFLYFLHFAAVVGMLLTIGSRGTVLSVVLLLALLYHLLMRQITIKSAAIFAIAGLTFAHAYGVFRSYSEAIPFSERVTDPATVNRFLSSGLADGARMVAGIVENTQKTEGFRLGETYWNLVYYPIPRNFFPEKPRTGGQIITEEIFYEVASVGTENLVPTMVGEAYLNFHVFGIIVVSALFGVVSRTVFSYVSLGGYNPGAAAIGSSVLFILYLFPAGEFINSASEMIKVMITTAGVWLVSTKSA